MHQDYNTHQTHSHNDSTVDTDGFQPEMGTSQLQTQLNNSDQVQQFQGYQQAANNSPQVQQGVQLQQNINQGMAVQRNEKENEDGGNENEIIPEYVQNSPQFDSDDEDDDVPVISSAVKLSQTEQQNKSKIGEKLQGLDLDFMFNDNQMNSGPESMDRKLTGIEHADTLSDDDRLKLNKLNVKNPYGSPLKQSSVKTKRRVLKREYDPEVVASHLGEFSKLSKAGNGLKFLGQAGGTFINLLKAGKNKVGKNNASKEEQKNNGNNKILDKGNKATAVETKYRKLRNVLKLYHLHTEKFRIYERTVADRERLATLLEQQSDQNQSKNAQGKTPSYMDATGPTGKVPVTEEQMRLMDKQIDALENELKAIDTSEYQQVEMNLLLEIKARAKDWLRDKDTDPDNLEETIRVTVIKELLAETINIVRDKNGDVTSLNKKFHPDNLKNILIDTQQKRLLVNPYSNKYLEAKAILNYVLGNYFKAVKKYEENKAKNEKPAELKKSEDKVVEQLHTIGAWSQKALAAKSSISTKRGLSGLLKSDEKLQHEQNEKDQKRANIQGLRDDADELLNQFELEDRDVEIDSSQAFHAGAGMTNRTEKLKNAVKIIGHTDFQKLVKIHTTYEQLVKSQEISHPEAFEMLGDITRYAQSFLAANTVNNHPDSNHKDRMVWVQGIRDGAIDMRNQIGMAHTVNGYDKESINERAKLRAAVDDVRLDPLFQSIYGKLDKSFTSKLSDASTDKWTYVSMLPFASIAVAGGKRKIANKKKERMRALEEMTDKVQPMASYLAGVMADHYRTKRRAATVKTVVSGVTTTFSWTGIGSIGGLAGNAITGSTATVAVDSLGTVTADAILNDGLDKGINKASTTITNKTSSRIDKAITKHNTKLTNVNGLEAEESMDYKLNPHQMHSEIGGLDTLMARAMLLYLSIPGDGVGAKAAHTLLNRSMNADPDVDLLDIDAGHVTDEDLEFRNHLKGDRRNNINAKKQADKKKNGKEDGVLGNAKGVLKNKLNIKDKEVIPPRQDATKMNGLKHLLIAEGYLYKKIPKKALLGKDGNSNYHLSRNKQKSPEVKNLRHKLKMQRDFNIKPQTINHMHLAQIYGDAEQNPQSKQPSTTLDQQQVDQNNSEYDLQNAITAPVPKPNQQPSISSNTVEPHENQDIVEQNISDNNSQLDPQSEILDLIGNINRSQLPEHMQGLSDEEIATMMISKREYQNRNLSDLIEEEENSESQESLSSLGEIHNIPYHLVDHVNEQRRNFKSRKLIQGINLNPPLIYDHNVNEDLAPEDFEYEMSYGLKGGQKKSNTPISEMPLPGIAAEFTGDQSQEDKNEEKIPMDPEKARLLNRKLTDPNQDVRIEPTTSWDNEKEDFVEEQEYLTKPEEDVSNNNESDQQNDMVTVSLNMPQLAQTLAASLPDPKKQINNHNQANPPTSEAQINSDPQINNESEAALAKLDAIIAERNQPEKDKEKGLERGSQQSNNKKKWKINFDKFKSDWDNLQEDQKISCFLIVNTHHQDDYIMLDKNNYEFARKVIKEVFNMDNDYHKRSLYVDLAGTMGVKIHRDDAQKWGLNVYHLHDQAEKSSAKKLKKKAVKKKKQQMFN